MHVEPVEIDSDVSNSAVMRHPGRRFPGVLVQGDTLSILCSTADRICARSRTNIDEDAYLELNELRNSLWGFLIHYKTILGQHDIPLPFVDTPPPVTYEP